MNQNLELALQELQGYQFIPMGTLVKVPGGAEGIIVGSNLPFTTESVDPSKATYIVWFGEETSICNTPGKYVWYAFNYDEVERI